MPVASLIAKGGPLMFVLLALSALAVALVLYKAVVFLRLRRIASDPVEEALAELDAGDVAAATSVLADRNGPLVRVVAAAIRVAGDPRLDGAQARAEIARVGSAEVRALESGLRPLASIAHLSPLIGLLGTVVGMIQAFMAVERVGSSVDPSVLSGGIWAALLTTAFGLTIAIPSMAALYIFEGEVDRIRAAMKDACVRVLVHFDKAEQTPDIPVRAVAGADYGA